MAGRLENMSNQLDPSQLGLTMPKNAGVICHLKEDPALKAGLSEGLRLTMPSEKEETEI
jgi:hypothetical protein